MPAPKPCGAFPRLQRRAVRLNDSKVLSVSESGGAVRILLDAYVVVSTGSAGTAWSQELELDIAGGVVRERPQAALWITDGSITIGGEGGALVPLPFDVEGEAAVSLSGSEGRLSVTGQALTIVERSDPRFIEKVPGGLADA